GGQGCRLNLRGAIPSIITIFLTNSLQRFDSFSRSFNQIKSRSSNLNSPFDLDLSSLDDDSYHHYLIINPLAYHSIAITDHFNISHHEILLQISPWSLGFLFKQLDLVSKNYQNQTLIHSVLTLISLSTTTHHNSISDHDHQTIGLWAWLA
ncbi:hypothetical protein O181_053079, partial [Austropuccinia psidii MF-1]|nr:hypothetical protein [Austropuccinia psidii MF-1]